MKTLTILIPVFNTADYLRRCLDSVLVGEVLGELELIVVNDGSTDGSAAIIREYQRRFPDTVLFVDKENGGHGSAIMTGLRLASGRYFRVLDSDDWFDTPAFLRYMEQLSHCREDLIVTPYTQEYTADGREVAWDYPYLRPGRSCGAEEIRCDMGMPYFTMASSTYRTELLRACGLSLFERCSYVDMQYNLEPIPYVRSLRCISTPVYRYRMGRPGQSMSAENLLRRIPQHQKVLCFLIDYYARWRVSVPTNIRRYMAELICRMYYTHADLLCNRLPDRRAACRALRELEDYTRQTAPDIYRLTGAFPQLRLSRRLRFLDLLLFPRLPAALIGAGKKLFRRGAAA